MEGTPRNLHYLQVTVDVSDAVSESEPHKEVSRMQANGPISDRADSLHPSSVTRKETAKPFLA